MPRSRDLILFIVSALFLLGAILFTVSRSGDSVSLIEFSDEPSVPVEVSITSPVNTIDRPGTIARLREKIGQFLTSDEAVPSVPVSVETVSSSTAASSTEQVQEETDSVTLLRCGGAVDGLAVAAKWPREGVFLSDTGGVREVAVLDAAGVVQALAELPLYPSANASPACLDSEIVGVTPSGSLIFNTDAISYDTTGSDTLIGYARDGFPIYGQYEGETDACGGYQASGGYRYGLSRQRTFMIGCFSATPQPLTP